MADYAGISLFDVDELDYCDYLILRRDAFIHTLNQTEEGREYLDNAYRLSQTKQDRKSMKTHFGKEGE